MNLGNICSVKRTAENYQLLPVDKKKVTKMECGFFQNLYIREETTAYLNPVIHAAN